jgi:hypothetical protein
MTAAENAEGPSVAQSLEPGCDRARLDRIISREALWIAARRRAYSDAEDALSAGPHAGLALSGGGIRSATFSLGLMQAMSRHRCFAGIDYLSTVSGGSYIGSFFGALYVPPEQRFGEAMPADAEDAFVADPLGSPRGRAAVARLREFGRYLTPGGTSDLIFGTSLIARNWLAVQLVLGLIPLCFFLLLRCLATDSTSQQGGIMNVSGSSNIGFLALASWLIAAGLASGYWLSRKEVAIFSRRARLLTPVFFLVALATFWGWLAAQGSRAIELVCSKASCAPEAYERAIPSIPMSDRPEFLLLLAVPTCAISFYLLALLLHGKPQLKEGATSHRDRELAAYQAEETVRARMTRWLANANTALAVLLVLLAVNLLGERLMYAFWEATDSWGKVKTTFDNRNLWAAIMRFVGLYWPMLCVLAPVSLTIWANSALRRGAGPGWLARSSGQTVLGFSILLLWGSVWAAVAAGIRASSQGAPWLVLVILGTIITLQGLMYGFLNLSSLVTLYAARLKRAYVGASNPATGGGGYDVDQPGDLVPTYTYYGTDPDNPLVPGQMSIAHARPLHLINATVAQTEAVGESQVVAYDRKGLPLHVGPAGVVSGIGRSDATVEWREFDACEQLSLSEWTAISGAAASTAMGSFGSLGLSVLTMMTNVRLGYWWKQDERDNWEWPRSWRDTVPGYLFSEMAMHFDTSPKTKRRWYLTDGGHFENTGVYALLQRRLQFIVVSDNGADPDYNSDDMVRLVQRARIDLDATITFLSVTELDAQFGDTCSVRKALGLYEQLMDKASKDSRGGPYAAMARIVYDDGTKGWLMLVKPRLTFEEAPELLAYQARAAGRQFPQQTTLDQFFDEEQWEAYRRLGEVVGDTLFAPVDESGTAAARRAKWLPGDYLRFAAELPK